MFEALVQPSVDVMLKDQLFMGRGWRYYTGMVDTVAHIPDRCYIADGYVPSSYSTENWKTGKPGGTEVRFINFEDQTGEGKVPRCVAYFFSSSVRASCSAVTASSGNLASMQSGR